jgi:hypothetical protein
MSFVVHRVAKSAARYTDAGGREKCGYCRFFVAPRACGKVIGPVSPQGWCKYFSRQVAQQYSGAGITGGGGPPGMTLDLNFMSSGNMPAGVTFTRASSATYTDASGVIQTAATNAPRWDYANGVLRGLLIEEARTNTQPWSGDLSHAPWAPAALGVIAPTVTGNNVVAPDGTLTAARIVMPAVPAGANASFVGANSGSGAVPTTFSIWLRGAVGGEIVNVSASNFTVWAHTTVTLTTVWQRYSFTTTPAGNWTFFVGADMRDATQTPTPAQTFHAWGAQCEAGAFPTSYIPTTSATVTRAADVAVMPANVSWYAPPPGTIFVETLQQALMSKAAAVVALANGAAGPHTGINVSGANTVNIFDNTGGLNLSIGAVPVATPYKVALAFANGSQRASLNGAAIVSAATATITTGVTLLAIGGDGIGSQMNSYIRRVQFWPRQLTDAELQQVTT